MNARWNRVRAGSAIWILALSLIGTSPCRAATLEPVVKFDLRIDSQPLDEAFITLIAIDEFNQRLLGTREVVLLGVRIGKLTQRGIQMERLAGVAAEIDKLFKCIGAAW